MTATHHKQLLVAALAAVALLSGACSGGGTSAAGKTSTSLAQSAAATATQVVADGPPPTATSVAGFIQAGFTDLKINYTAVNIPSFRKVDVLLKLLDDCDKGAAGGASKDSPDYWATVLGDCYTVGDALGWLYQHTVRKDFLYANILMRRFNRQKFEQAVAAGAKLDEGYWTLVTGKIYSVTPISTPIAVTPIPPGVTPTEH